MYLPDPLPVVYAVGDIHGCHDLLVEAEKRIVADGAGRPGRHLIVHLGDYVDRGPRSADVLDRLTGPAPRGFTRVCLAGNHDEGMLRFLEDPGRNMPWLEFGGDATLRSYGLDIVHLLRHMPPGRLAAVIREAIPQRHVDFLRDLPISLNVGRHIFVHAGLQPGLPLEDQQDEDLMWIREPFLTEGHGLDFTVVHGHTPSSEPSFGPGRIGIDTGAYMTGRLTVLRVEAGVATVI